MELQETIRITYEVPLNQDLIQEHLAPEYGLTILDIQKDIAQKGEYSIYVLPRQLPGTYCVTPIVIDTDELIATRIN